MSLRPHKGWCAHCQLEDFEEHGKGPQDDYRCKIIVNKTHHVCDPCNRVRQGKPAERVRKPMQRQNTFDRAHRQFTGWEDKLKRKPLQRKTRVNPISKKKRARGSAELDAMRKAWEDRGNKAKCLCEVCGKVYVPFDPSVLHHTVPKRSNEKLRCVPSVLIVACTSMYRQDRSEGCHDLIEKGEVDKILAQADPDLYNLMMRQILIHDTGYANKLVYLYKWPKNHPNTK